MRLLVLGGTRFIGDRIVRAAQRRGDEVTIVHRGSTEPADEPAGDALAGHGAHIHIDRADFAAISAKVGALRPDAVIDTCAMTQADGDSVLPHLPDVPIILLSSMDVYRAYELLLADEGGQPVPITEDADLRRGRYPLRGHIEGHDDYDKLHVEPAYLARGGTVLRLGAIYGERDPQRREEFILRRVRAGRKRIPVGAGTWLWTRAYVADVASAVLAALDAPAVAAGQVFNVGELATDTMREHAQRILRSAECDAELVTVPDEDVPADLAVTRSAAQHFLCDSGKLARALGWQPTDTELAVSRSVRWHLAHFSRKFRSLFAAELPRSWTRPRCRRDNPDETGTPGPGTRPGVVSWPNSSADAGLHRPYAGSNRATGTQPAGKGRASRPRPR